MEELIKAINLLRKYNKILGLDESIIEFEEFTNQKVPKEAIDEFKFCGLNNVDFFTSSWLNNYGLKNLLEYVSSNN